MKTRKFYLKRLRKVVRKRGGTLLSRRYVNQRCRIQIRCRKGHIWFPTANAIMMGTWCPHCRFDTDAELLTLKAIAKERNGKCLSPDYLLSHLPMKWRCSQGHIWFAPAQHIKQGTWCPKCRKEDKLTLAQMRQAAHKHNGRCLARSLPNSEVKVAWQCSEKHRFMMNAGHVNAGRWCPHCAKVAPLTIELMRQIAKEHGGTCLSKRYVNNRSKLNWRCSAGHRWKACADSIRQGSWCPHCDLKARASRSTKPLTIEQMQRYARSKGGRCLSIDYVNNKEPLLWQCSAGHKWHAAAARVCRGSWCPHCSRRAPLTIEEMQKLADAHGGVCLSKRYVNNRIKLRWRCAKGHQWKAQPVHIKAGHWCPKCAFAAPAYV